MWRRYFSASAVALTTRLESDAELFSAEIADVLLRWRRLSEFHDHHETRTRAAEVEFAYAVTAIVHTGID